MNRLFFRHSLAIARVLFVLFVPATLASLSVSCGGEPSPSPSASTSTAPIGTGVVARVGPTTIASSLVADVASAEHVTAKIALDRVIEDALAAHAATARALDRRADVAWSLRTALARAALARIARDADAEGPPTAAELAAITERHWLDVDVPERVIAVHAVALRPKSPDAAAESRARAIAAEIAAAVAPAKSADDFMSRARAVAHDGVDVEVQSLDPFVADARVASPDKDGTYDPKFVAAAFATPTGANSGVVETPFGWHVIRVVDRLAPIHVPPAERAVRYAAELRALRLHARVTARLDAQRREAPVEVSPAATTLMNTFRPAD